MKNKSLTIELILLLQKNRQIIYNTRVIAAILLILNNKLKEVIYHDYLKDKQAQQVLNKLTASFKRIVNKLILFKELVYVTEC